MYQNLFLVHTERPHIKGPHSERRKKGDDHEEIKRIVDFLDSDKGKFAKICVDIEGNIKVIWLQTAQMEASLKKFAGLIEADGTYRVNRNRMPVYTFLVIDGNGDSIPCAHAFLAQEDEQTLSEVLEILKFSSGESYRENKIFLIDKDFTEIASLKKCFPSTDVHICHFHISQTFRRKTSSFKEPERTAIRYILQKMLYVTSSKEYDELYISLQNHAPDYFKLYFKRCWHSCKEMWVQGYQASRVCFGEKTTNILESFHQKIKTRLSLNMSVMGAMNQLLAIHTEHFDELEQASRVRLSTRRNKPSQVRSDSMLKILGQYNDNCTQLASKKIEEQLEYVSQCFTKPSKNQYAVTTRKGKESHMVNSCKTKMGWTCTCCFNQQSELPCRHIFSVLTYLGRPLFELSLIPDRWRENCCLNTSLQSLCCLTEGTVYNNLSYELL